MQDTKPLTYEAVGRRWERIARHNCESGDIQSNHYGHHRLEMAGAILTWIARELERGTLPTETRILNARITVQGHLAMFDTWFSQYLHGHTGDYSSSYEEVMAVFREQLAAKAANDAET